MGLKRHLGIVVLASCFAMGGLSIGGSVDAEAKSERSAKRAGKLSKKKTAHKARRSAKRGKKRRGRKSYFSGHGVTAALLRTAPVERPSGHVWVYSENFREEYKVDIYRADGSFDEGALAELDKGFRCKRTGETRAVDPRLYETLSVIYDHFGSRRIDLVSGFRFQQGEGSRHYHASAMDIRIEGVSDREVYEFAESLDAGGMGIGIYPRSGFVHVDYRAPGDPSYRWTDRSPPDSDAPAKRPSRRFKPKS